MTGDPLHPGETLREELDALGVSTASQARTERVDTYQSVPEGAHHG